MHDSTGAAVLLARGEHKVGALPDDAHADDAHADADESRRERLRWAFSYYRCWLEGLVVVVVVLVAKRCAQRWRRREELDAQAECAAGYRAGDAAASGARAAASAALDTAHRTARSTRWRDSRFGVEVLTLRANESYGVLT